MILKRFDPEQRIPTPFQHQDFRDPTVRNFSIEESHNISGVAFLAGSELDPAYRR